MSDLVALRDRRERAIALLSDAFARDSVDLDEFERRLTLVHNAASVAEIEQVVCDVAPTETATPLPVPASRALVPLANVEDRARLITVMGSVERNGSWAPGRHTRITTVMGSVDLDFREARLPAGPTEIEVTIVMGSLHLIVPPELPVEMEGVAVLGSFEHLDRAPAQPDPERPLLRIRGVTVMGSVEIETRLPGESEGDARRRRRRERKALRARNA